MDRRAFLSGLAASALFAARVRAEESTEPIGSAPMTPLPTKWVLNGSNHLQEYSLSLFDLDGYQNPFKPVVANHNDGGALHVTWASGMELPDGTIRLFGSRFINNCWQDVGVWDLPPNGQPAVFKGTALSIVPGEVGIGPSTLFIDPSDTRPYKIICLSRKPGEDISQSFLASSETGAAGTWRRDGVAVNVDQPWEHNACANFVVWLPDENKWALFSGTGVCFADDIGEVFDEKVQVMFPNGLVHDILECEPGTNSVRISGEVRLGEPYFIFNAVTGSGAPIYPEKQEGDRIYFPTQMTADYSGGKVAHMGRIAYGVKYAWRKQDGTWGAFATCQGMSTPENPHLLAEYTVEMEAPAIRGPWSFSKKDIVFKPWNGHMYASCENPAPILGPPEPMVTPAASGSPRP